MKVGQVLLLVTVSCFLVLLGIVVPFLGTWVSSVNREAGLRNQYNAKLEANKASFDTMWKTISQVMDIPTKYEEGFRRVIVESMKARNPEGKGSILSFLQESKIDYTPELYRRVLTIIESKRDEFQSNQEALASIWKEHNDMLTKFPSSFFLSGKQPLQLKLVTSTLTEGVFETGKDDSVKPLAN